MYELVDIRFCEGRHYTEDVIPGVIEFYNSITSICMIISGIMCLILYNRYKQAHISLLLNGVSSMLYHSKFLWIYKLFDEITMMYCICYSLIHLYNCIWNVKSRKFSRFLNGIFISSFIINIIDTEGYIFRHIFGILFVILLYLLTILHYRLLKMNPHISRKILVGFLCFVIGGCMWVLDELFCSEYIYIFHSLWHILLSFGTFILLGILDKCYNY